MAAKEKHSKCKVEKKLYEDWCQSCGRVSDKIIEAWGPRMNYIKICSDCLAEFFTIAEGKEE